MKYFCIKNKHNNVIGYGNKDKYVTENYKKQFNPEERFEIIELEDGDSRPLDAKVSDDFCGDCGRKFNERDEKIIEQKSITYGGYYKGKPICRLCSNKRYEIAVVEYESNEIAVVKYESKNSR